ncbi:uncharacterized protein LOC141642778 [Silene latifolia]|uniref:uncharacterized protein LOC141642778 n=1 Tax=Silene latifolia TaxID=37657 RepID=UPI003D785D4F
MMRGLKTCSPFSLLILSLSCFFCNLSEARLRVQRHSSAVVVGTVYCHTCFQHDVSKGTDYISGATVAVECVQGSTRQSFYQEVNTDKQGNFKVDLPFSVSKHVRDIQGCTVKLVKSNEPYCAVASTSTSSQIHLKERKGGQHIYSAGFFTFKPLKQPGLCNQQSSETNSKLNSLGDTLPGLPIPQIPNLLTLPMPDIPTLPVPGIPTLPITNPLTPTIPGAPSLPNVPLPPLPPHSENPIVPTKDSKVANGLVSRPQGLFPPLIPPVISPPSSGLPIPDPLSPAPLLPNPLQPPPSPLIPNPLQPPTPPAGIVPQLPPLPTLPLVPGVPGIPGVPGFTPPTPSPSPIGIVPTLPPLPTIPVVPGIPGVPALTPPTPSTSPVGIVPTLPPLPTIPEIPGVPALTPPTPTPQPPASLLPPLLPPGIPGLPPAKLKTANP